MCHFLTKKSKQIVEQHIRRTTASQKVNDIFSQREFVLDEMYNLSQSNWSTLSIPVVPWILANGDLWQTMSFVVALALNIIMLGSYRDSYDNCRSDPEQYINFYFAGYEVGGDNTNRALNALGIALCITSGIMFLSYVICHAPLIAVRGLKRFAKRYKKRTKWRKLIKKKQSGAHFSGNMAVGFESTLASDLHP